MPTIHALDDYRSRPKHLFGMKTRETAFAEVQECAVCNGACCMKLKTDGKESRQRGRFRKHRQNCREPPV